jgi:hypothetical protein
MRIKKIIFVVVLVAFIFTFSYFYSQKKSEEVYLKTVVYKDNDNTLVPVSLNFYNEMDIEEEVINRIDMMKSDDFVDLGLYPILSDQLTVNHIDLDNSILTIDFNDQLYANDDALDIIEALTYTLCDYDEVNQLQIQVNGNTIDTLPNSEMTVSSLTNNIGLNNFNETTSHLHHTYSIMVYSKKTIHENEYYVPTASRIDEDLSTYNQVELILSHIDSSLICNDAYIEDNILYVELDSSLLLEDGTIDQSLLELMSLSLSSLEGVNDINYLVDGETIEKQDISNIQLNYIKR